MFAEMQENLSCRVGIPVSKLLFVMQIFRNFDLFRKCKRVNRVCTVFAIVQAISQTAAGYIFPVFYISDMGFLVVCVPRR